MRRKKKSKFPAKYVLLTLRCDHRMQFESIRNRSGINDSRFCDRSDAERCKQTGNCADECQKSSAVQEKSGD